MTLDWRERPLRVRALSILPEPRSGRSGEGHDLAEAIVEAVRVPLLVLDRNLQIVTANPACYRLFATDRRRAKSYPFETLAGGQWQAASTHALLAGTLSQPDGIQGAEVEAEIPASGCRTLRLDARRMDEEGAAGARILLSIADVTESHLADLRTAALLCHKDVLLQDMQHRIANSLQIVATILLQRAGTARSEETRSYLKDAHHRIMAVATVQRHLDPARHGQHVALAGFLVRLCEMLELSVAGEGEAKTIAVRSDRVMVTSGTAVSIGLIVTELVLNAVKHAFVGHAGEGRIQVDYQDAGPGWRLTVSDNGVGMPDPRSGKVRPGQGTDIVAALVRQLGALYALAPGLDGAGMSVSITYGLLVSPKTILLPGLPVSRSAERLRELALAAFS